MTRDQAELIALKALTWMGSRDGVLEGFLASTGSSADDLRRGASDPGTQLALLDHLMGDDRLVTAFCDEEGLPYDAPMRARGALPGGESHHWT